MLIYNLQKLIRQKKYIFHLDQLKKNLNFKFRRKTRLVKILIISTTNFSRFYSCNLRFKNVPKNFDLWFLLKQVSDFIKFEGLKRLQKPSNFSYFLSFVLISMLKFLRTMKLSKVSPGLVNQDDSLSINSPKFF